jgi:hypothetical protein
MRQKERTQMKAKLIQGSALNGEQRAEVLARFVHRWTHENARQTYNGCCPGCEQSKRSNGMYAAGTMTREQWHAYHVSLVSDAQWLADHAFYVNKDGTLSERYNHCEPAYMADLA